jgi:hypothetical protein
MEAVMLSSADFRSFASTCFAAHYSTTNALPGEELLAAIGPGEERHTSLPDTKCLLTFLVEIKSSRGERVGHCEFRRNVFLDLVTGIAMRRMRREGHLYDEPADADYGVEYKSVNYCLHFSHDAQAVQPRFKVPQVREADFGRLLKRARQLPLSVPNSDVNQALMITFMTGEVYSALNDLARKSEESSVEEGCFLDGEILFDPDRRQFARLITECIPALHAERGESQVRITGDCWAHYYRMRGGRGTLLAEGHSHPGVLLRGAIQGAPIFISTSDRSIHRHFFWQFFQSTVIVSKPAGGELAMGIWGHADGLIVPEHEAYILPKRSTPT